MQSSRTVELIGKQNGQWTMSYREPNQHHSNKRSRWGQHAPPNERQQQQHQHRQQQQRQPQPQPQSQPQPQPQSQSQLRRSSGDNGASGSAVSEGEAMKALLSSAYARERERNGLVTGDTSGSSSNKRRRFDSQNDTTSSNSAMNDMGNEHSRWGNRGRGNVDGHRNHPSGSQRRRRQQQQALEENDSYYGPARARGVGRGGQRSVLVEDEDSGRSKAEAVSDPKPSEKNVKAQKPDFGLSGALAKDTSSSTGGNVYRGVVLKFQEPPEARTPNTQWRFYVFKGKDLLETLHISKQSAYLMGRHTDVCDIVMQHPSLSSQHAVLQYRALPVKTDPNSVSTGPPRLHCQPFIMDLESTNGTLLNGVKIDSARYYQLKKGDVLTFGASTREYVLMTENTTSV